MNTLHPIFQQALAPFAPLLNKDGSAASPAMAALFNTTYSAPTKRRRIPGESFTYCLSGVDLVCEMDYEAASGDGWNEPRDSARAYVCDAVCAGVDITELLSDMQKLEIENAYLEQDRSEE